MYIAIVEHLHALKERTSKTLHVHHSQQIKFNVDSGKTLRQTQVVPPFHPHNYATIRQ